MILTGVCQKRPPYVKCSIPNETLASIGGAQTKSFTSDEYLTQQKGIPASAALQCATVYFSPGEGEHNVLQLQTLCRSCFLSEEVAGQTLKVSGPKL